MGLDRLTITSVIGCLLTYQAVLSAFCNFCNNSLMKVLMTSPQRKLELQEVNVKWSNVWVAESDVREKYCFMCMAFMAFIFISFALAFCLHVCLCRIPWNWSYVVSCLVGLGIEPGSSSREVSALNHMYVCGSLVCLVTREARRGHWIPWDWSYRWLWAAMPCGCWESKSGFLEGQCLNCWAISPALRVKLKSTFFF